MALKWAVASGNWSSTATWNGSALPGSGDEVHAGGFTVTIDQDVTVASLSTHLNGSAAAGGGFVVSSMTTRNISAAINGTGTFNSTTVVLTVSATSGTLNLTGAVFGSSATAAGNGVAITGAGSIVVITGNVSAGGAGSGSYGITMSVAATVNITGNVVGGGSTFAYGMNFTGAGTSTITGNVTGGAGSGAFGINLNALSVTLTVTGTVSSNAAAGINATGSCNLTLKSTLTATPTLCAVVSTSTAAVIVAYGPFVSASDGTQALYAVRYYTRQSTTTTYTQRDDSAGHAAVTISNLLAGLPATGDVRDGTTYGSGGTNTGTLKVPAAGSVALGVPVDATTGTAALTPAAVWAALISGLTTSGSIGERLANASTVATNGDQLATALNQ